MVDSCVSVSVLAISGAAHDWVREVYGLHFWITTVQILDLN